MILAYIPSVMHTPKPKVLLGMSGGVDSSVSAGLLLEQGYEVIGAFMKNWSGGVLASRTTDPNKVGEEFTECGWKDERRDAMRVAAALGIPFLTFDFEEDYRRDVVEYLFREAERGRTPNPDIMCNKYVKFDRFVKEADRLGCEFIATGHYARREGDRLLAGTDDNKDQTYFLWAINPEIVSRVLFPVGGMLKPDVREKARAFNLPVAEKKDSTGICFVGEVDMKTFLSARLPNVPGNVVLPDGKVIGKHDGLAFYTIGQREGLGIGGGTPYYVAEKRLETNELLVAPAGDATLYKNGFTGTDANWFDVSLRGETTRTCGVRIRYRTPIVPCTLKTHADGTVNVTFSEPQWAVTPGQSAVFYDGEEMLGGAIIDESF